MDLPRWWYRNPFRGEQTPSKRRVVDIKLFIRERIQSRLEGNVFATLIKVAIYKSWFTLANLEAFLIIGSLKLEPLSIP